MSKNLNQIDSSVLEPKLVAYPTLMAEAIKIGKRRSRSLSKTKGVLSMEHLKGGKHKENICFCMVRSSMGLRRAEGSSVRHSLTSE